MAIDAAAHIVSYNGITFPKAFTTTSVAFRPVYDAAGRTVTHTIATVEVKSQVAAGATQAATLEAIRNALERPGGELVVSGKGLGVFEINTAGNRRDLKFGPCPRMLKWRTLGGDYAAEIVWQCDVTLVECDDAPWAGKAMEFTYRLSISTDEGGYSTRVFSGAITIPMTRVAVANGAIPDTADNYFDRFVPQTLPNFKRKIQRDLDESKAKLTFTVTDEEMAGNPLPEGVVSASASHEMANETAGNFAKWVGTLSGEYELQKGRPRSDAKDIFLALLKDRADADRRDGWDYFPLSFRLSEPQIYGKTSASFSLTYRLVSKRPRPMFDFPSLGIWRPVPGGDWNRWSASLNIARDSRGIAGLRHRAQDDVIVDLCLGNGNALRGGGGGAVLKGAGPLAGNNAPLRWGDIAQAIGAAAVTDPYSSWLRYNCKLVVEPVDGILVHRPLPTNPLAPAALLGRQPGAAGQHQPFSPPVPAVYAAPQATPQPVIQGVGSTGCYLRLVGDAVRIGHEIPPPTLVGVGPNPAYPMNGPEHGTYFETWTGMETTQPVQMATWNLRWFAQLPQGASGVSLKSLPRPDQPTNTYRGSVR